MSEKLRARVPLIERNLCVERGCSSSCCHDMWFYMIENPKDYFCNPKRLPNIIIEKSLEKGVYFAVSGGQYKVTIIGKCPNLDNESCRIYPNRPPGCKKIRIDSIHCHQARERDKKIEQITINEN